MIYLSGRGSDNVPPMLTPAQGNAVPLAGVWAADTGCFRDPGNFNGDRYLGWLAERVDAADRCLFATAPDRFGDGAATLAAARPLLPGIRAAGFRAAYVAQPGAIEAGIPWAEIDALFIGGPDAWQLSAACWEIGYDAKRRGKWLHGGRVNSRARLRAAELQGCDSADGTYVMFAPDLNDRRAAGWLDDIARRPLLFRMSDVAAG